MYRESDINVKNVELFCYFAAFYVYKYYFIKAYKMLNVKTYNTYTDLSYLFLLSKLN